MLRELKICASPYATSDAAIMDTHTHKKKTVRKKKQKEIHSFLFLLLLSPRILRCPFQLKES